MWAKYSKNHNTSVTGMLPYCATFGRDEMQVLC